MKFPQESLARRFGSTRADTSGRQWQQSRALELDGIRGWASLSVMLFHVFFEMLGHVVPGLRTAYTSLLFDGTYSVMGFFILSGDALSASFFTQDSLAPVNRLVIKRYFRLTLPIFMSCLGVYLLMIAGLDWHSSATVLLHNEEWLGRQLQFDPTIYHLLTYSFMGVYTNHVTETSFNPFLWTMQVEILGSMLIFLFCYVWNRLRRPFVCLVATSIWLWLLNSFLFLFTFGMILSYLRRQGIIAELRQRKYAQIASWGALLAVAAFIVLTFDFHFVKPITMGVASALMLALYVNKPIVRVMSSSLFTYFGEISFPLYLSHYWVLISLMSWLVVSPYFLPQDPNRLTYAGLISALTCILVAHLFSTVEQRYLRQIDKMLNSHVILDQ